MIQSTNLTLIFHLLNALINVHVCVFSSMQLVMYEFVQDTEQFHYKDRLCYPFSHSHLSSTNTDQRYL